MTQTPHRLVSLWIRALLLGLFCGGYPLHAEEPKATAKILPEEIRAGGTAVFTLTVDNGQPQEAPQLTLPEGLQQLSDSPSYSSQTAIVQGKITQSAEFRWEISASKNGEYNIPPQEIALGSKILHSNPTKLVVKNNPAAPASPYDPLFTIEIDKREIYVGETVPVTVNLYLRRNVMVRRIGLIEVPKENFAIQRFPQHSEDSAVTMGGEQYLAFTFHSTLSALKAGKFKLGPATCDVIIDLPLERGMHPFMAATEPRKVRPVSNDIEVNVLPLPDQDKPANFTGVVGDFEMSATADVHDLTVGDPISVELNVTGSGNFDTLSPPALSSPQPWKLYPARRTNIPRADSIPEGGTHSATFNQVLIPRQLVDSIPSYEFNYFSPTKKKYLTARTQPIALHMQPAAVAPTATPAKASSGTVEGTTPEPEKVTPPAPKITDILTVLPNQVAWSSPRPVLFQDPRFRLWNWAALGVLGVMILGKLLVILWRVRARATASPVYVLGHELRRAKVPRGQFYQMAAHYVQMSHDSSQPLPEPVREVLARNEQINYSPEHEKADEVIPRDERAKVLEALKV